ncbi:MAG: type II secretion system protein [Parcubacteria group bacterium]|nr:type II secretion system protein [Parcubacteria group bacterium]
MRNITGFTLIELLVVITIIGILASVVLVQFPDAMKRARDGRVISSMGQFRTQSRIIYANSREYTDIECKIDSITRTCSDCNVGIKALCNDIGENTEDLLEIYVNDNKEGYCASVQLNGSEKFFCIDGAGEDEVVLHAKEYDEEPEQCSSTSDCAISNDCRCE